MKVRLQIIVLVANCISCYMIVDHENRTDGVAVEQLWMDIQQAVYSSPSGNMLRDLACVDLQVDLCSQFTTEHQNRSKVHHITKQVKLLRVHVHVCYYRWVVQCLILILMTFTN